MLFPLNMQGNPFSVIKGKLLKYNA